MTVWCKICQQRDGLLANWERAVSAPSSCGLRAVTFERVKMAMDEDEEMVELRDILVEGETPREDVDTGHLKSYIRYIKKESSQCWME